MPLSATLSRLAAKLRASQKGFTMIELLIVIAILGILAVAVLAAINPIEQINRGRDTGTRSDAEQLLGAIDRFYAFQGYNPWLSGATDLSGAGTNQTGIDWIRIEPLTWNTAPSLSDSVGCAFLAKLGSDTAKDPECNTVAGELKDAFVNKITGSSYNHLYIYNRGDSGSDSTYVCFNPASDAFKQEIVSKYDSNSNNAIESNEVPADYPPEAYDGAACDGGYCVCLP